MRRRTTSRPIMSSPRNPLNFVNNFSAVSINDLCNRTIVLKYEIGHAGKIVVEKRPKHGRWWPTVCIIFRRLLKVL